MAKARSCSLGASPGADLSTQRLEDSTRTIPPDRHASSFVLNVLRPIGGSLVLSLLDLQVHAVSGSGAGVERDAVKHARFGAVNDAVNGAVLRSEAVP